MNYGLAFLLVVVVAACGFILAEALLTGFEKWLYKEEEENNEDIG